MSSPTSSATSSNNSMASTAATASASAATGSAAHRRVSSSIQQPPPQPPPPPPQRPVTTASRRPTTTATTTASTATSNNNSRGRRLFALFGMNQLQFQFAAQNMMDATLTFCTIFVEKVVLVLGPMLIIFASGIISALTHTFFTIVIPLLNHSYQDLPVPGGSYYKYIMMSLHIGMVLFLLTNIIFNYFMCVTTRNKGPAYDQVVRELAVATNFVYPESPAALEQFRRDYEDRMILRMRRRQAREREHQQQQQSQQRVDAAARLARDKQQQQKQAATTTATAAAMSNTSTTTTTTTATTMSLDTTPAANSSNTDDLESCSSSTNMGGGSSGSSSGVVTLRKNAVPSNAPTDLTTAHHPIGTTTSTTPKKRPVLRNTTTTRPAPPKQQALPSPKLVRNWMLMAPDEWGYCARSHQAKPPRSHYDHVTKTLVLCLDHFCPWMFNAIGYFNYRYFCNFLWFVELGMMYGVSVTYVPFMNLGTMQYKEQVRNYRLKGTWQRLHPMTPFPYERMALSLSFMLCLAIGIAVFCLASFHAYLILTGQTTIEFHGNWVARSKFYKEQKLQALKQAAQAQQPNGDPSDTDPSRKRKQWRNPYDFGYQRNWQQVYGRRHPLWAVIVPSSRPPEFLPLPIAGELGRRRQYHSSALSSSLSSPANKKDDEDCLDVEEGTTRNQALVV